MKDCLRLIKHTFDSSENEPGSARVKEHVAIFVSDESGTAEAKIDKWFSQLPLFKLYRGWDYNVYPRYEIIKEISW